MDDTVIDRLAEDQFPYDDLAWLLDMEELADEPRCCNVIPCRDPEGCPR